MGTGDGAVRIGKQCSNLKRRRIDSCDCWWFIYLRERVKGDNVVCPSHVFVFVFYWFLCDIGFCGSLSVFLAYHFTVCTCRVDQFSFGDLPCSICAYLSDVSVFMSFNVLLNLLSVILYLFRTTLHAV